MILCCSIILAGIVSQSEMELHSVSVLYEQCPIVIIGEVLCTEVLDDSIFVSFLVNERIKGSTSYSDTLILHIPPPSFGPGAPHDIPPPESHPTEGHAFGVADEYLVFANAEYRIECCGSRGDGYYLFYPHNDYYLRYDLWHNYYNENILTESNLLDLQNNAEVNRNYDYKVQLSLPHSQEIIELQLDAEENEYRVVSGMEFLDGHVAQIVYLRRYKWELFCRDANDLRVTIGCDSGYRRREFQLLGNVSYCIGNEIWLDLNLVKPLLTSSSQMQEYLLPQRIDPVVFDFRMFLQVGNQRIYFAETEFKVTDESYLIRLNGDHKSYLRGIHLPIGVLPDCRFLIMRISYLGLHEGGSDYIAFEIRDIPEDFVADIPFQLYSLFTELETITGNVYVIDDDQTESRWFCFYEATVR